ncbi:MAG: GAF domain-containing protein, partial [Actinobacteria bacterium]|nr:GAF domain-containing protein [Actinomycetota bacterium]NIS32326.1 GAF domain-containing protein [Actinomycetota bacterium]NIT96202.1 GAF domain-containing protein [Actinomycetota bacterium]NIU19891.1 GAF domain-containing protein [Actinomycetota bacterium]NIU67356.1 GAF domain-containing protein [Actinomycetota bacterium]
DHERLGYETLVNVGELAPGTERFPVEERHTLRDRPGLDAVLTGEGFVRTVDDGRVDDPGIMALLQRELRSEAAAPIVIGDAVWGVVWASTRDDGRILDHDDLATLHLVAEHAATAVTQAERIAEFEELALRDPLT